MIGRAPEIIQHPVHVADRRVVGDELSRALRPQGCGRHDVSCHGHDLGGECRGGGAQVDIAAQRQVARAHLSLRSADVHLRGARGRKPRGAGSLEDAHPQALGRCRETQGVVEWVQMTAVRVVEGAAVALGREDCAQLLARHVAHARVAVALAQLANFRVQLTLVALLDGGVQVPRRPVTVDREAPDQLAHQRQALDRDVPHRARGPRADEPCQFALAGRDAIDRLRAAAPRGAPAHTLLFEQHHAQARERQVQRGGAAGDACADHAHIAVDAVRERGTLRCALR